MTPVATNSLVNPRARHGFRIRASSVTGVGSYVPARVVANAELASRLGVTEQWIFTRTGIRERRIAADGEQTSDLAAAAARQALVSAGIEAAQVELIIVATNTADMLFPATACLVQASLGARRAAALDLKAAGAGFLHALEVGQQFVMTQTCDTVLVVGAEKLSAVVDWNDRNTAVLFGDGAGAVVLQNRPEHAGVLTTCLGGNGDKARHLFIPGGGSRQPANAQTVAARQHFLRMEGRGMFRDAVHAMHQAATEALDRCQLGVADIRCIIPHQSNRRIIDAFSARLGARAEQVFVNLERSGNTSGASVPMALAEAVECGRIRRGDLVLLVAFGAGLTWAAAVVEWW